MSRLSTYGVHSYVTDLGRDSIGGRGRDRTYDSSFSCLITTVDGESNDVDPVTNKAFVLSTGIPALNVIDGSTNMISATLPGISANYVSVDFVTAKVYVSGNSGVTVLTEK